MPPRGFRDSGVSHDIDVRFSPTAVAHSTGTVTVHSNASNGDQTSDLSGDGVDVSPVAKVVSHSHGQSP